MWCRVRLTVPQPLADVMRKPDNQRVAAHPEDQATPVGPYIIEINFFRFCGNCGDRSCVATKGLPCPRPFDPAKVADLTARAEAVETAKAEADLLEAARIADEEHAAILAAMVAAEEEEEEQRRAVERTCREGDCTTSLDESEGWDGYCGLHGDLVLEHIAGGHRKHEDVDCPECT